MLAQEGLQGEVVQRQQPFQDCLSDSQELGEAHHPCNHHQGDFLQTLVASLCCFDKVLLKALLCGDEQLGHYAREDPVLPMGVRSSESAEGLLGGVQLDPERVLHTEPLAMGPHTQGRSK